jgi:hypothetical protein
MAARLRELRNVSPDNDLNGSKNEFLANKQNLSAQLALSSNYGSSESSGGNKPGGHKFSGSDFGQIIEEDKEEHKANDEFNNRSHVHKRF